MGPRSVRVDQDTSRNWGVLADNQEVSKQSLDITRLLGWLTVKFSVWKQNNKCLYVCLSAITRVCFNWFRSSGRSGQWKHQKHEIRMRSVSQQIMPMSFMHKKHLCWCDVQKSGDMEVIWVRYQLNGHACHEVCNKWGGFASPSVEAFRKWEDNSGSIQFADC